MDELKELGAKTLGIFFPDRGKSLSKQDQRWFGQIRCGPREIFSWSRKLIN